MMAQKAMGSVPRRPYWAALTIIKAAGKGKDGFPPWKRGLEVRNGLADRAGRGRASPS